MLDGACRIADLAAAAKGSGMPAIACTDHGNMCGAVEFYQEMTAQGIKPVIGCEFYVAPTRRAERNPRELHVQGYHLVLLAEDITGYQNLCRLNAAAWLEGFYYKPRIDMDILAENHEGLVALSACIAGEIPLGILSNDEGRTVKALQRCLDIFGRHSLYLELQDHGLPEEAAVNKRLTELGTEYGVPLVATNDVHYVSKSHASAHDVLLCIGTQSTLDDPARLKFSGPDYYLKSAEEMYALFPEHPEALRNTLAVAERCNVCLELGENAPNHFPVYEVEAGDSRGDYLRGLCIDGLRSRYGIDINAADLSAQDRESIERMDYELGVIEQTGFTSYFLVVWDFLHFARQQDIPVGPGRGSGAGSIVAYLTHITDIDPLQYGLLFERFLNPDRISPPDFDIDLCERRRHEVIAYVRDKYGAANVAQIGTFGTLKAKQAIKDVARALGHSFADSNRLTRTIPSDPKMTLKKAMEESGELRQMMEQEEWVREVLSYSEILEGLSRNMSIHAAGVIIGNQPLTDLVPLGKGANGEVITQYSAGPCEDLGLLKMDFLGLRTLTILQDTYGLIERCRGVRLTSAEMPLDDAATFELLNKGNTVGVFQLESAGMRDLCRRFGLDRIEDVIALIALYRPGPMQFLDDFIARKTGGTRIDYDIPEMEPILRETYGIMLYQEQVMQVVQEVAGFSLGRADILRRAMGKKKAKEMAEQYDEFVAGCQAGGISKKKAAGIWDKIAKFAGYGFNKSHSAAYAMLSYRTAYLKTNYPTEFMASVLSSELGNSDKLAFFLHECGEMGIVLRPPDVNASGLRFSVDGESIRFGMAAIKGVGSTAAQSIIEAREDGVFTGLTDFCERVGPAVNRRVLESLCQSGALDCFGLRRSQVFAMLDEAVARAQQAAADRLVGQGSLFDLSAQDEDSPFSLQPPDIPEWDRCKMLGHEKELLGFYVTGHPIAEYADIIETYQIERISDLAALSDQTGTRVGGIVANTELKHSKRDNRPWAIVTLESLDAVVECMVFADAYETHNELITPDVPVFVEGVVSKRENEDLKLLADRIIPVEQAPELLAKEVHVRLHQATTNSRKLEQLLDVCEANEGQTTLILCLICATGEIAFVHAEKLAVRNTSAFRQAVKDIFGEECLLEKADKTRKNGGDSRSRPYRRNGNTVSHLAS